MWIEARLGHEVVEVDTAAQAVTVRDLESGAAHRGGYDRLLAARGAVPFRPAVEHVGLELAEVVILGTGVRRDLGLAEAAGVEIGPSRVIAVGSRMATNVPGVWVAGNCAEKRHLAFGRPVAMMVDVGAAGVAFSRPGRSVDGSGGIGLALAAHPPDCSPPSRWSSPFRSPSSPWLERSSAAGLLVAFLAGAARIAAAAFDPGSARVLGAYGLPVLAFGTAGARRSARRVRAGPE